LRAGDLDAAQVSTDYAATIDSDGQELALMQITLRDARRQQDVQRARTQQQHNERVAAAQAKAHADAEAKASAIAAEQQRTQTAQRAAIKERENREAERVAIEKRERASKQQAALAAQRAVVEERERASKQQAALAAQRVVVEERERVSKQQAALELQQCQARKAGARAEPKRSQGDTAYFAALAIGHNNSWGEASGYPNRQQAEDAALRNCREQGKNCKVQAWSNDCLALARDAGKAAGWAWGGSRAEAERKAISFCEEHSACCSVATAYCADEVQ
jgi:hypothetical protein